LQEYYYFRFVLKHLSKFSAALTELLKKVFRSL